MPVSEAQKRATAKYEREKYDKVLVRFPKGTKQRIQEVGADSVNGYIIKCVLNSLDDAENAETGVQMQTVDNTPKAQIKPNLEHLYKLYGEKIRDIYTQLEIQEKYGNETLVALSEYARNKDS